MGVGPAKNKIYKKYHSKGKLFKNIHLEKFDKIKNIWYILLTTKKGGKLNNIAVRKTGGVKIKTIDINARDWFDRVNGNSYFSATVIINYGRKTAIIINLPFQYGCGDHYIDMASQELIKLGYIRVKKNKNNGYIPLWAYCQDNKIILRTNKQENCKKRDL